MWGTSCQIHICGHLFGKVISELVKQGVVRIQYWSYAKIIFPAGFAGQGVLNKDPTVWPDNRLLPISQHGDTEFCLFTEILLDGLIMQVTSWQIHICGDLFGNVMSKLVKQGVGQIQHFSYAKIIFPAGFAGQGVLNKVTTVPLDDKLPPIILNMSLTNS